MNRTKGKDTRDLVATRLSLQVQVAAPLSPYHSYQLMIGFKPHSFTNFTPINSTGITVVDLGELHEGASEGVEVACSSRLPSLPPISVPRSHGTGVGRHGSLPPTTPAAIPRKIKFRMPNFDVEEVQETLETYSDCSGSVGDATSQGEPEGGEVSEVPLRGSVVRQSKDCFVTAAFDI